MSLRIAIVGLGKIAHDQHLPAIAASDRFELVAAATHAGSIEGIALFTDIADLLASDVAVDAIAMCQPPQVRFDAAAKAIRAGTHVLLEKPPGATLAEVAVLAEMAADAGTTLFAAWHSRHAPGVERARAWLARRTVKRVEIVWKEDVRRWHPGQQWIWEPGGLGVFDPGINALSIVTRILPEPLMLRRAMLQRPVNRAAPIAATLDLVDATGATATAVLDWRQTGPQSWNIAVETDDGMLTLSQGGAVLAIDGVAQDVEREREYPSLYARFAELIETGRSDVDAAPLRLVADAFLRGRQDVVDAFDD